MYPGISLLAIAVLAALAGTVVRKRAQVSRVPRALVLAGLSFAGFSVLLLAGFASAYLGD
jgi:hypothetical protein